MTTKETEAYVELHFSRESNLVKHKWHQVTQLSSIIIKAVQLQYWFISRYFMLLEPIS